MKIPEIKKTPGDFDGAQFNFEELLHIVATEEVTIVIDTHTHACIAIAS